MELLLLRVGRTSPAVLGKAVAPLGRACPAAAAPKVVVAAVSKAAPLALGEAAGPVPWLIRSPKAAPKTAPEVGRAALSAIVVPKVVVATSGS